MDDETDATIQQQPTATAEGYAGAGNATGMDPAILVILLLVLAFVIITNVWLRNRAQGKPTFAALQRLLKGGGRKETD